MRLENGQSLVNSSLIYIQFLWTVNDLMADRSDAGCYQMHQLRAL